MTDLLIQGLTLFNNYCCMIKLGWRGDRATLSQNFGPAPAELALMLGNVTKKCYRKMTAGNNLKLLVKELVVSNILTLP